MWIFVDGCQRFQSYICGIKVRLFPYPIGQRLALGSLVSLELRSGVREHLSPTRVGIGARALDILNRKILSSAMAQVYFGIQI